MIKTFLGLKVKSGYLFQANPKLEVIIMTYIVLCGKCRQKSLCEIDDIDNPEERKCSVCGTTGDDIKIETSVEEAMPPLDLIAKGIKLK